MAMVDELLQGLDADSRCVAARPACRENMDRYKRWLEIRAKNALSKIESRALDVRFGP